MKHLLIEEKFKKHLDYQEKDGRFIFKKLEFGDIDNGLDKLKNKFKKFDIFYQFLIQLISPVFIDNRIKKFLSQHLKQDSIALNVGSGNSQVNENIYNVDIFEYDNVDIVCDIVELPFEDNSVDLVLNLTVLEHVPNPQKVIDEIYRVLRPGGVIYTAFPFIQGFHASPYDFTRVTKEGIKVLHKDFDLIEVKPFGGPTSGLLWVFQEWVAIVLSFGSKKLHLIIYLLMMLLTFPIKFIDYLLIKHPMAENISSGFVYIGKKQ